MKKKHVILGMGVSACLMFSSWFYFNQQPKGTPSTDKALLSIIKNDQSGFENYLNNGGSLDATMEIEGKKYRVDELLVKYERVNFISYISGKKISFGADSDIWSEAVAKNNPELLNALKKAFPDYKLASKEYGELQRNLLHLASSQCSYKVIGILHESGMNWNDQDKKGATPLTLAAESDCLHALSYWKEKGADFQSKDGRGLSALSILRKKNDSALMAFASSFLEKRSPTSITVASAPAVPNFYKKRVIPKDNLADRAHLIEPEDRPEDAYETSANSEFSD